MADVTTVTLSGGFALLGVAVGGALEWVRDRRTRHSQDREQRFGVYSDFAGAIAEYRRAELDRRMRFGARSENTDADALVYQTRVAARRERYRVEMLTGSGSSLARLAEAALEHVEALKDEADENLTAALDRSTEAIEGFVSAVAESLRSPAR